MNYTHIDLLLRLITAHVISDFILQSNNWVENKQTERYRSKYLYLHVLIVGLLTYLAIGNWTAVWIPLIITISHFFIDLIKTYIKKDSIYIFLVDQALHLLVLLICWFIYTEQFSKLFNNFFYQYSNPKTLIILLAYIVVTIPMSIIIPKLTKTWSAEVSENEEINKDKDSLTKAGKWIGVIERLLVLSFSIIGKYEAIGFLLAAKTVFRFGELKDPKDRKRTEYILIGTFISFAISIAIGISVHVILKHYV